MKTSTTLTLSALLTLLSAPLQTLAQDESGAHDGLLPLTTLPLTNSVGSTTGSQTLFATAITTSSVAGGLTTIYSDISGIVTPTSASASETTGSTTSSGSITVTTTSATASLSGTPSVTVLSGGGSATTTETTSKSSSTSATGSAASASASGSASPSASGSSAADRVVVSGLGVMGAIVAGLFAM